MLGPATLGQGVACSPGLLLVVRSLAWGSLVLVPSTGREARLSIPVPAQQSESGAMGGSPKAWPTRGDGNRDLTASLAGRMAARCATAGARDGGSRGDAGVWDAEGSREAAPSPPHGRQAPPGDTEWRGRHLVCRSPKNGTPQGCLQRDVQVLPGDGWQEPCSQPSRPPALHVCPQRSQLPASTAKPKPPCPQARGSLCHPLPCSRPLLPPRAGDFPT